MDNLIANVAAASIISLGQVLNPAPPPYLYQHQLASSAYHEIPLNNRQPVPVVNDVFKDNILLNLAYLKGQVTSTRPSQGGKNNINWEEVKKPFEYKFTLKPNETFAFHEDVLPEYEGKVVKTTNAHFNFQEGFKTDGYLYGDGVCHLASLMFQVAKDAGLEVKAPSKHDFAVIPNIPKEDGVAIYFTPGSKAANAMSNLYITNPYPAPVTFYFNYQDDSLKLTALRD